MQVITLHLSSSEIFMWEVIIAESRILSMRNLLTSCIVSANGAVGGAAHSTEAERPFDIA